MIEMFFVFMFLHALGDYPLQGEFLAKTKGHNLVAMIAHCLIWSGLIYFGLISYGIEQTWHISFLFFGHMTIDFWKCSRSGNGKELTTDLWIDQFCHILQILFILATI